MVWFWPNTDPEYKDIITKKKPAFIPELDDPSFSKVFLTRDIPCGYWSHVVNCKSCHSAYKSLNALEVILQVISIVSVGIVAATRHSVIMSTTGRITVVSMAAVCFAASRWLARYIYKNFHCHDYDHTLH
ncbi:hypothetical protein LWI29_037146 [Acer saccharum]|uniref:Uncharacterized protein n=1 Tax=Acer saccharum TaxID=4024 RepID=A0AA39WBY7_ACESA|nr:hypothetical protein LWI29_037146 [Acer saccharum]